MKHNNIETAKEFYNKDPMMCGGSERVYEIMVAYAASLQPVVSDEEIEEYINKATQNSLTFISRQVMKELVKVVRLLSKLSPTEEEEKK